MNEIATMAPVSATTQPDWKRFFDFTIGKDNWVRVYHGKR
jgi:hypothetical protein